MLQSDSPCKLFYQGEAILCHVNVFTWRQWQMPSKPCLHCSWCLRLVNEIWPIKLMVEDMNDIRKIANKINREFDLKSESDNSAWNFVFVAIWPLFSAVLERVLAVLGRSWALVGRSGTLVCASGRSWALLGGLSWVLGGFGMGRTHSCAKSVHWFWTGTQAR